MSKKMSKNKKEEPIVLLGRVPCCGYDCSDGTAYVTLTDEYIKKIGDRYLELLQKRLEAKNEKDSNII